eukprot:TRINITY_DN1684_c0_g3_i1.p1 TRINITY_DN1684_c0_g3~~TRINITY_DN1684_c0_g3_i1.p1  ORF type:complete len:225 (+),score=41.79 TRINITY_DN1684_c0_g3_i1:162-836(+)
MRSTFMVVMAYERYLTIVKGPNSASKKLLVGLTAACIVVCVVYATFPLYGIGLYAGHNTSYTCFASRNFDYVVDPFLILSMLFILGCVNLISFLNYRIFLHVRAVTSAVAHSTGRSALNIEIQVAKSLVLSVCLFVFAWAPFPVLWLLQMISVSHSQGLIYVGLLTAASYSIGNPILYFVFNNHVQKMVLEILPSCVSEWLDRRFNEPYAEKPTPTQVASPRPT